MNKNTEEVWLTCPLKVTCVFKLRIYKWVRHQKKHELCLYFVRIDGTLCIIFSYRWQIKRDGAFKKLLWYIPKTFSIWWLFTVVIMYVKEQKEPLDRNAKSNNLTAMAIMAMFLRPCSSWRLQYTSMLPFSYLLSSSSENLIYLRKKCVLRTVFGFHFLYIVLWNETYLYF